jgi:hypothetical protein
VEEPGPRVGLPGSWGALRGSGFGDDGLSLGVAVCTVHCATHGYWVSGEVGNCWPFF